MGRRPYDLSPLADAYLDAIERFHTWCDARGMNFRVELTRMIETRVGGIDQPLAEKRPVPKQTVKTLLPVDAAAEAKRLAHNAYMRAYLKRRREAAKALKGAVHV